MGVNITRLMPNCEISPSHLLNIGMLYIFDYHETNYWAYYFPKSLPSKPDNRKPTSKKNCRHLEKSYSKTKHIVMKQKSSALMRVPHNWEKNISYSKNCAKFIEYLEFDLKMHNFGKRNGRQLEKSSRKSEDMFRKRKPSTNEKTSQSEKNLMLCAVTALFPLLENSPFPRHLHFQLLTYLFHCAPLLQLLIPGGRGKGAKRKSFSGS